MISATTLRGVAVNSVLLAILGYVALQFAIGVWVSRRVATETDYILAGRTLGAGLVSFSVFATFFGSEAVTAAAACELPDCAATV
jgi:Na+/proline symporter